MSIESRFWAKVDKRGGDDCWEWVGAKDSNGYGVIGCDGCKSRTTRAHRVSMEIAGFILDKGIEIDHICHNTSCVNPSHLRVASHRENLKNMSKRIDNKSGFKGVCWDKNRGKWLAKIKTDYKTIFLGRFDDAEVAHKAYCAASIALHGAFSNFG